MRVANCNYVAYTGTDQADWSVLREKMQQCRMAETPIVSFIAHAKPQTEKIANKKLEAKLRRPSIDVVAFAATYLNQNVTLTFDLSLTSRI